MAQAPPFYPSPVPANIREVWLGASDLIRYIGNCTRHQTSRETGDVRSRGGACLVTSPAKMMENHGSRFQPSIGLVERPSLGWAKVCIMLDSIHSMAQAGSPCLCVSDLCHCSSCCCPCGRCPTGRPHSTSHSIPCSGDGGGGSWPATTTHSHRALSDKPSGTICHACTSLSY